ncbi:TonB-dependent receptor [Oceanobacter kriegii]|uniref:TonB-dependent receptor n=1 Tax=Oceanobacter kriegii TaxID=64972 RepID=UPI0003FD7389|nr:TonB-dependent receptor [Oceanobacter kriegii]
MTQWQWIRLPGLIVMATSATQMWATTSDDAVIPEVVVQARYWQEAPADVPDTVNVIDSEESDQGIAALAAFAPNVRIEDSSVQTRVVVRGSGGFDTGLYEPVAYYYDGVALPLGGSQLPALDNARQIELVKGPQGSLYGRNSEAGVIKVYSQQPSAQSHFQAQLNSGQLSGADGDAAHQLINLGASGELVADAIQGSIGLSWQDSQGPNLNEVTDDNESGSQDRRTLNAGLKFLTGSAGHVQFNTLMESRRDGKGRLRYDTGMMATDRYTTNYNTDSHDDRTSRIHSINVVQQLGNLKLEAVTGLTRFDRDFVQDLDLNAMASYYSELDLQDRMLSQEMRLSSEQGDLKWLAGLYAFKEHTDVYFEQAAMVPQARTTDIKQRGVALFGQAELALTSALKVGFGLRGEKLTQQGDQTRLINGFESSYGDDSKSTTWLPKVFASYALADDRSVYLSYAKGYMPGGYNYTGAGSADTLVYDKETSRNLEAGFKLASLDQRLNLQASVFHIATRDKQVTDVSQDFSFHTSNAASVVSQGAEVAAEYRFENDWSLKGQLGYLNTEAEDYEVSGLVNYNLVAQDYSGNDLPYAPKASYGLTAQYDPYYGFFASVNLHGSSEYYFDSANSIKQDGYRMIDADLGYRFTESQLGQLEVALVATNLTNEEVFERAVTVSGVGVAVEDKAPRYIGVRIGADF